MEQLVILLVIGVISLVNWAIKKSQEKRAAEEAMREGALERAQRHAARRAASRRPGEAADPMRELLEALGLPPDAAVPATVPPPPAREAEEFASLEDAPAPAAPGIKWARDIAEADEKTRALASAMAATASAEKARGPSRGGWRALLSGREAQRRAFVAAEIFGRPRGEAPMAWPS